MTGDEEVEANMVLIEAKPLAMRPAFRRWSDAIAQADLRAALTRRRYVVRRTPHGHWWLTETTKRVPIHD